MRLDLDDVLNNAVDQDKGKVLELADPFTGEPTGLRLTIVGPDSATAKRARLELADQLVELADDSGRVNAADREKARHQCLARLVIGWEVSEGGKPVPFETRNVLRLLSVSWVEQQVDAFAANRRNFSPSGERSSVPEGNA